MASGPGTLIKLIGDVTPDPSTGRLTTVFDNLPQLPFDNLTLTFFDGPRAVLANPQTCGTFTAGSTVTAWSGQTASPASSFDITGCADPMPFAPSFLSQHGTLAPAAPVRSRSSSAATTASRTSRR